MGKKYIDTYWDFKNEDTKQYTHCFHKYPAMMIPQIAREILNKYKTDDMKVLFDPYCGTGTSLVEGSLKGMTCFGTDLNPLARLISSTKVLDLDINSIKMVFEQIKNGFSNIQINTSDFPDVTNVNFWFKETQLTDLAKIRKLIKLYSTSNNIENFFLVAFSETLRDVSLTRNGEFKLYRIKSDKIASFNPNTFKLFTEKVERNINGYAEYRDKNKLYSHHVYDFNTSLSIPSDVLSEKSVDFVITSPPYGDSHTTVAYGQFSTLSNEWLGIKNARKLDNMLMGGNSKVNIVSTGFEKLDNIISNINSEKPKRAKEIFAFYQDYSNSINNVSKLIKPNGIVAYVVGNRRVNNIELPTDEFTRHMFEKNNFEHLETIIRDIPNKRQPALTSPTNKVGAKVATMSHEYIVIMKKCKD